MNIFQEAARLSASNTPFALVTITKSLGSTPRSTAHMIVLGDGRTVGTVGGGIAEYTVITRATEAIAKGQSTHLDVSLQVTEGHACGGALEFYIDVIAPKRRLLLFGGGHVNEQIARLAGGCGFRIEVIETRAEYATAERFPTASEFHVAPSVEEAMKDLAIDEQCSLIIATHGLDKVVLEAVVQSNAAYIGMLGSRTKVNGYRRYLRDERGIDPATLGSFYSPVGLDIGSETPEEIAISVIAELMMVINHRDGQSLSRKAENLVIVRGAGDLATGVITRLAKAGYRVCALEVEQPTTIRRTVAFSEAVYEKEITIEGISGVLAHSDKEAKTLLDQGKVAVVVDPDGKMIQSLRPAVVVDAIIAKKNVGTTKAMAPMVIALGPGFEAGIDCHYVIETQRGHYLGTILTEGSASPNTGFPGIIDGVGKERVIHAPQAGVFEPVKHIGDLVQQGDIIGHIDSEAVVASIDGVLRGLLHGGLTVPEGFKIADIDPRGKSEYCYSISDKARALGGSVLELISARQIN